MPRIKICHLSTVHSPFDTRIYHKECKSLVRAGYEVTLIAQHDKNETVDGVKIIALPRVSSRIYRIFVLTLKAFWLATKQNADIYHFHDPELIPTALFLKLITRKKLIYDVHEDYGQQVLSKPYIPNRARRTIAYLTKIVEHYSSKFYDYIVCATADIMNNYTHRRNIGCVKNFPIMSIFKEVGQGAPTRNGMFNLIYVGGLSEIRGINEMIMSLGLIKRKVKLTLCGNYCPDNIEAKVRGLDGFDKVRYMGWLEHETIVKLMDDHDAGIVCLHPIRNYITSLPIKLFEYMASGLPVIASNFPLWKEIVEGNGCGICVDPLNPEEIARAIQYLMESPEEARKMGENGRKAILHRYNWEQESGKLVTIYRKVLGQFPESQ